MKMLYYCIKYTSRTDLHTAVAAVEETERSIVSDVFLPVILIVLNVLDISN